MENEKLSKYEQWVKELNELNDIINSLSVWDEYADYLQGRYDRLLKDEPQKDSKC